MPFLFYEMLLLLCRLLPSPCRVPLAYVHGNVGFSLNELITRQSGTKGGGLCRGEPIADLGNEIRDGIGIGVTCK